MRRYTEEVAAAVGCDLAYSTVPALAFTASAIGGRLVVSPKRGYAEPPSLFGCIVGDSGTAKSPASRPYIELANRIETSLEDDYRAAFTRYEVECDAWKLDPDGREKPRPPAREYFLQNDVTVERLVENLSTSPGGLFVYRDELAGWFGSFTRYKGTAGGSDVPVWLSLFDGGPVCYQRRTGHPRDVRVRRGVVSVFGGIQPGILRDILADPGYAESGLAGRMLFAIPPKHCPRWSEKEVDFDAERDFTDVLMRLRSLPLGTGGPGVVRLDTEAKHLFVQFSDRQMERAEDMDGGPMAAALPKMARIGLRLALIHHCVQTAAAGLDPGRSAIGVESMAAGIELADWFAHEAERVYAMLAERPEDRDIRRLVELVRRKSGRVSPRDLQRANPQKYPSADAAESALEALVGAGWGRWDGPTRPGPGRPSRVFLLNPTPDTSPPGNSA